jgi:hypothetical protein
MASDSLSTLDQYADDYLADDYVLPDVGEAEGYLTGEVELWRAVIRQALMDIGTRFASIGQRGQAGNNWRPGSSDWRAVVRARREAAAWFTAPEHLSDLEEVCGLAGYNPDFIRSLARKLISEFAEQWATEDEFYAQQRTRNPPIRRVMNRRIPNGGCAHSDQYETIQL